MDFVVLGAGALGSLFGGYLAQAGHQVTLIGHPNAHMEAVQARGLEITGVRGHHVVTENLTAGWDPGAVRSADVLIVGVKAKDMLEALAGVSHLVGKVGSVMSLQNTITKDDVLADHFGWEVTVGAATIEAAAIKTPGHVHNAMTVPATLWLGEHDKATSPRVTELVEAFDGAGLGTRAAEDIKQVQWEKLAQICLMNAFSVPTLAGLPGAGLQEAQGIREGAEIYASLAAEVLGVYGRMGYAPQDFFAPLASLKELAGVDQEVAVERVLARAQQRLRDAKPGPPVRSSLVGDLERGRQTEAVEIIVPFLEEAEQQGFDLPVLRAAYRNIRVIEALAERHGGLCQQRA